MPQLIAEPEALHGLDWLVLDAAAPTYRPRHGKPVSGVNGRLGPDLGELSGPLRRLGEFAALMRRAGNLVIRRCRDCATVWQAGTGGNAGAFLEMRDDGDLCQFTFTGA